MNFEVPTSQVAEILREALLSLSFVLFVCVSAFAQQCAEPAYHAARNYETGLLSTSKFATADFNRDGNPDVVTAGSGQFPNTSGIAVLFGNEAGSFEPPLLLPYATSDVLTGDFNGDDNPDIVLTGLRFLYGDGAGNFLGPEDLPIFGDVGGQLYSADFNNDGRTDLYYMHLSTVPFSSVLLSNSSGGFHRIDGPSNFFKPNSLGFGDLNGDSRIDLIGITSGGVQVALGDGAGHFIAQPPVGSVGSFTGPGIPQIADFNHDGKQDVVINHSSLFRNFFAGNGAGGFASPVSQQTAMVVELSADFNADGHVDIAGRDEETSAVFRVGLGDGTGQFTDSDPHSIGGRSAAKLVADFNRDGKLDIASISSVSHSVSVVLGDGAGTFEAADSYFVSNSQLQAAAAGDFNGDGKADFAAVEFLNDRIHFYNGNGNGSFTKGTVLDTDVRLIYFATGDFNHDSKTDLVGVSTNDSTVVIFFGGLTFATPFAALPGANFADTGDFNGDGHLDIVATGFQQYGILLGNGAAQFSPIQITNLGTSPSSVSVADFTGDGKLDFALANLEQNSVSIFIGNGSGGFTPGPSTGLTPGSTQARTMASADFNSDTKTDLAVANPDFSIIQVFRGNGDGTFGSPTQYDVEMPGQVVTNDLNLDGRPDLVVLSSRFGSNMTLFMNDGTGGFQKKISYGIGDAPRQLAYADFNGDGKSDFAVANSQGSYAVVILSAPCHAPDLKLKKSHEGSFAVGAPGVYKLQVTNVSLARTVGPTTITDALPAGLSYVSGVGDGWQCLAVGQLVTCTHNSSIEVGEKTELIITVTPGPGALPGITNTATVSHPLDTNHANDVSSDPTIVNNGVSITGRVVDELGTGLSGSMVVLQGAVTQTVTVNAAGAYSFSGLPEGLTYEVTPSKSGRYFTPVKKVFKNLRGGASGDFIGRTQTNGKIVFSRLGIGRFHIWTMNADGSGGVQLTNASDSDSSPQWSPDGSMIAFQRGEQNAAVWVMNADGSNLRRVTPDEGVGPVWSPDGRKLAFTKGFSATSGIYTINFDGSGERRIFTAFSQFLSPLSWSPDGSSLAFTRQLPTQVFSSRGFHLYSFDPNRLTQHKLIVNNPQKEDFEPDYSPDGLKLVYLVYDGHLTYEMAVANSDGTGQTMLGQVSSFGNPSWSPDGARLVFVDNFSIWSSKFDGTDRVRLTPSGGFDKDPDWQPLRSNAGPNHVDDAEFFVRQHYQDFLNRTPDPSGLAFWKGQITSCGGDQQCVEIKRINVSAAFFLSIEFQQTGYFVERIYKTAYGDNDGLSTLGGTHTLPVPIVRMNEFLPDSQQIGQGVVVGEAGWEALLNNNKQLFVSQFVERARFKQDFPLSMSAVDFVDRLNGRANNPLSQSERNQLVADLTSGAKTRAQVVQTIAEDQDLFAAELNRAFVLMQYFGYLRRNANDPSDSDYTGYDFWLRKLDQFNGNFVNAEMVKAFILSSEYRQRFAP